VSKGVGWWLMVTYLLIGWRHYDVIIGWRHKTTSGLKLSYCLYCSISKPPLAGSPSEHCDNVWYRKTRMVGMDMWRIELCRRQWLWSTVNVGRSNEGWHCKWSWVTFEGHCKRFRCLSFKNTVYIISKVNYNWWTSLYEQLFLYCSIRSEKLLYDVERPVSDS